MSKRVFTFPQSPDANALHKQYRSQPAGERIRRKCRAAQFSFRLKKPKDDFTQRVLPLFGGRETANDPPRTKHYKEEEKVTIERGANASRALRPNEPSYLLSPLWRNDAKWEHWRSHQHMEGPPLTSSGHSANSEFGGGMKAGNREVVFTPNFHSDSDQSVIFNCRQKKKRKTTHA